MNSSMLKSTLLNVYLPRLSMKTILKRYLPTSQSVEETVQIEVYQTEFFLCCQNRFLSLLLFFY